MEMDIFLFIAGAVFSWILTHCYYKKSLESQKNISEDSHKKLLDELSKLDSNNKLLARERRIEAMVKNYRQNSNIESVIDAFNDLSQAEKFEMLDDVLLRVKGRRAKNNPYK